MFTLLILTCCGVGALSIHYHKLTRNPISQSFANTPESLATAIGSENTDDRIDRSYGQKPNALVTNDLSQRDNLEVKLTEQENPNHADSSFGGYSVNSELLTVRVPVVNDLSLDEENSLIRNANALLEAEESNPLYHGIKIFGIQR